MKKIIDTQDIYTNEKRGSVLIEFPHVCPRCNQSGKFEYKNGYAHEFEGMYRRSLVSVIFLCPSCEKLVVGEYDAELNNTYECADTKRFFPLDKMNNKFVSFSVEIKDLSPSFVEIYNQSAQAEKYGLHEICGVGYRKALEFLVKDYAIRLNPTDREMIERNTLAKCIEDYLSDNSKISTLAKASAWLGNDETHYVRKHADYGLDNLKAFIDVMVSYIDSELKYQKACDLVNR